MRLSIVLSTHAAQFDAVALREDFETNVARIASLGYDGVELAVRDPGLLDVPVVKAVLASHGLAVPAIGTGQAWGEEGLSFTHPDPGVRQRAVERIQAQIALARTLGTPNGPLIIIGLIRGRVASGVSREQAEAWLIEALRECVAVDPAVRLVIEPINRYETDLVNTVDDALRLIECVGVDNLGILFDTFHANIEEPSITGSLRAAGDRIFHVHTADSNRWYPGAGHVDFPAIFQTLRDLGYTGWLSAEILPRPDPVTAAAQAIRHLRRLLVPGTQGNSDEFLEFRQVPVEREVSMKPKVYVTRIVPEKGLEMVREFCDAEVWEGELPVPRDVLLEKVRDIEGLYTLLTEKVDAELLDHAPRLKVVSNMAVGFDNIDVAECTRRGIPVGNTPGVLTDTTADFAWALLMAAARRVCEAERYVHAGKWKTWGPMLFWGPDVHGATLGIVGFGRIGRAVAKRARGFDMRILWYDNQPCLDVEATTGTECVDFDTLLQQADFVTLHTPLTKETYHLIGERELKLMKPTAILINTSRGPVVDPKALYKALKEGWIAYAALDVTEPEPIPLDDPLLTLENCLIVPHIASASIQTRTKMAVMAAENLIAGLKGERLPNCVNPEVYK